MFSRFFIDRPIFASVLSVLIVLIGAVSYFGLPTAQYPDLAPPVIRVEALYPGANARTIADTVASPVEQEVNGVDGMIYMSSVSSDGRYQLDVSFKTGTDVDMAAVLVQNRVSIATAKLPEDVRRQGVTTRKQSTAFVGVVSVYVPDPEKNPDLDDLYLSNLLNIRWRDEISRIPGVGAVNILPAKDYSMRVWLDPERLKARELTVGDVSTAIRQQNVQVAAGALGRSPAPMGTDFEYVVTTQGRLTSPDEFGKIIVKSDPGGGVVLLSDVARIERGARDYSTLATFNGRPNGVMPIYQLPGANLVEVAGAVEQKVMGELKATLPAGVEAKFFYDSSMFIKASLHEVFKTLFEAFVLVFIVVLVFLQSFRATLITAITIPVSLIGTFFLMQLLGFSINMLTMFGMILAIGIVVDDAIIVVENVERNMREHGLGAKDATIRAMGEIFGPVVAVTLVLMSVFIPTAFLPGITGEMYRQFALTIAASTGLSAICALTLSPALCAVLLKSHDTHRKTFFLFRPLVWAGNAFNWAFDRLTSAYAWVSNGLARFAAVSLLLLAGIFGLTGWVYGKVPTGFVPNEDLGFVVVAATLPDGSSLERTKAVIDRVSELARKVDGVQDVVTLSGFSVIQGQGTNYGNAWIVLKPWDERYAKGRSIDAVLADLNSSVAPIQEAGFLTFSLPAIQGLGNTSGFDLRLQDRSVVGRDALQAATDATIGGAFGQPQILAAFSGYRAGVPQLYLDIDREKVIRMGVPLTSVFETLQSSLGSAYVNDFNEFNRTFQVNMQAESRFRLTPDDVTRLDVRNASGQMVPLASFVRVTDSIGPDRIERYNMYESATVNGIPKPGASSGEVMGVMEELLKNTLPPGIGFEWSAMSYQERLAGGQGVIVFALGLLLVYLILAAQYESWTVPLAVVLSIPLVIIGALAALSFRGLDNNVFTQIGLVLLIGLGAKNAILIVEFARENRAKGMPIREAAILAARTRFRPIIMTSLAFILGVTPLLIATGAGAASRRALGTAVFGGMVGNTVLGLLLTPALYVVVQWTSERVSRVFRGGLRQGSSGAVSAPAPSP